MSMPHCCTVDFVFGFGLIPPCAKLNGDAVPIASHILNSHGGMIYGQAGSVVTLRPDITKLSDIEGKIVGSMEVGAADGMKYHLDEFASQGLHLLHMAKQVLYGG